MTASVSAGLSGDLADGSLERLRLLTILGERAGGFPRRRSSIPKTFIVKSEKTCTKRDNDTIVPDYSLQSEIKHGDNQCGL